MSGYEAAASRIFVNGASSITAVGDLSVEKLNIISTIMRVYMSSIDACIQKVDISILDISHGILKCVPSLHNRRAS